MSTEPDQTFALIQRVKELEAEVRDWNQIATGNARVVDSLRAGIRALCDEADMEARRFIPGADINMMPFVAADKLRALLGDDV